MERESSPDHERPKVETSDVQSPEEVVKYFEFADPILGVDWGADPPPEEYTPEYIAAHPEYTRIRIMRDANGEIIAGTKIKELREDEQQRLGLNVGETARQNGALFEYTAVKEEYRNQGLVRELNQDNTNWAREHGADYVCAEVSLDNPISAYTKIRDGFEFLSVKPPGMGIPEPYFVMVKNISDKSREPTANPRWKEFNVTEESFEDLDRLLTHGWRGVDMKFGSNNKHWTLILEH